MNTKNNQVIQENYKLEIYKPHLNVKIYECN